MKITKRKKSLIDKRIDETLVRMENFNNESKEYGILANHLKTLMESKGTVKSRRISADTFTVVLGNLLGLVLIMNYERLHVISTKALGFVLRGRV